MSSSREREGAENRYSYQAPDVLFRHQYRVRATVAALAAHGLFPLTTRRILDIGCGTGDGLADFEAWGASRSNLAGAEIDPLRVASAQARFAAHRDDTGRVLSEGADIRLADVCDLPWPDATFDLIVQSTLFTSILEPERRTLAAREAARVLRPKGFLIWFDFTADNPRNSLVRGIPVSEVRKLFPGFSGRFRATTLAPPLARAIVPYSWRLAECLQGLRLFNTHVLGVLKKG